MAIKPIGASYPTEDTPKLTTVNTKVTTATTSDGVVRNVFVSTSDPSGGADGDVWVKYIP